MGPHDACLDVELGELERDRLRGAQTAGVHGLEQGAVAQRRRRAAPRLAQQVLDLVPAQHLGQAGAGAGGAQLGGRVALEDLLAAQEAVK